MGFVSLLINDVTIESTRKLQAMISAVSTMLLKGLHGATSRANYRETDTHTTDSGIPSVHQQQHRPLLCLLNSTCRVATCWKCHCTIDHLKCSWKQQTLYDWNKNVPSTVLIDKTASGFKHLFWIPSVNSSRNQWATEQIPQIYRGCNCYIQLLYIYSNSYVTCKQVFLPVQNCVCE